jgi:hypothetical protein
MGTRHVLLLILVTYAASELLQTVTVTPSFRRLGYLGTGLSYGHIHGTIDFERILQAHRAVLQAFNERLKTSTSKEETSFIEALMPQMHMATRTLEDLQALFFGHQQLRPKRQLLLGLGLAMGLTSIGTSIYTATEVKKLHHEIGHLKRDFGHVAHLLEEEAHTVNHLIENFKTVKAVSQMVLDNIALENQRISMLTNVIGFLTLVGNLNAELSALGRGLESLANGKLHPSLVNHKRLHEAVARVEEKAKSTGRRFLHDDQNAVFKAPISYLATEGKKIIFIVHLALVDQNPMQLFEYLSTPQEMGNFFVEITAAKRVLATDERGHSGLEMTQEELLRCQTEERHNGRLFTCTNSNLIKNDIRKTCMGAIFFGHKEEVKNLCDHVITQRRDEEVQQIASDEILVYSKENTTLVERCKNGTKYQTLVEGLVRKRTKPGCEVSTRDFLFRASEDIEIEDNFLQREVKTSEFNIINYEEDEKIEKALRALNGFKQMEPIKTSEIQEWIDQEEVDGWASGAHWATSLAAGAISLLVASVILYLFVKYKKNPQVNAK